GAVVTLDLEHPRRARAARLERARRRGDARLRGAGRPGEGHVPRLRLGGRGGRYWAFVGFGLGGLCHWLRSLRPEDDETRRETEQPTAEVRPLHEVPRRPKNRSKRLANLSRKFRRGANRFLRRTSSVLDARATSLFDVRSSHCIVPFAWMPRHVSCEKQGT